MSGAEVFAFWEREGRPPVAPELAAELAVAPSEIEASFKRLADEHMLVLAPGTPYIWMANPLCGLPSPFTVTARATGSGGASVSGIHSASSR